MTVKPKNMRQSGLGKAFFVGFLLSSMVLFLALGFWQMDRLNWKNSLIAAAEDRLQASEITLPAAPEWSALTPEQYDFQKVSVKGQFLDCCEARVFIALPQKRGRYAGPGYWIVTAFAPESGGTLMVNRGFVPQELTLPKAQYASAPEGPVELNGYLRRPERVGGATLEPDLAKQVDWVINPARLNEVMFPELENVAPFYLNVTTPLTTPLPQPSNQAEVSFSNKHLEYAFTWFGLAALMPILAIFWLIRTRQTTPILAKSKREE